MGLFIKIRPTGMDEFEINQNLRMLKYHNEIITRTDNIEGFLNEINSINDIFITLTKYEKKYPKYFNPKPSDAISQFKNNKPLLERNFVERYIMSIERKLLDYSTMRGKTNNFNKKVDLFRYYSAEFCPETISYFEQLLKERFVEFI